jgi:hypothetical protein
MGLVPKGPGDCVLLDFIDEVPTPFVAFALIDLGYKSVLLIVNKSINNDPYIQNLEDVNSIEKLDRRYGLLSWIFQRDRPDNTSKSSVEWLENQVNIIVDWSPDSPDLSPTEMLCVILKNMVR